VRAERETSTVTYGTSPGEGSSQFVARYVLLLPRGKCNGGARVNLERALLEWLDKTCKLSLPVRES